MKSKFVIAVLLTILFVLLSLAHWRTRDKLLEWKQDWNNDNHEVFSKSEVEDILSAFSTLAYADLPDEYLDFTKSNQLKYTKLLKTLTYYKIPRAELYKRIAGPFRLKDFICKDAFYRDCIMDRQQEVICIFNPKIFHKTIALIKALEADGHDPYAFKIINGHRHPKYNEDIGGASLSRHIKGEAVDLIVRDINRDNQVNKLDKEIILELLEHQIIGNEGGIGLYPGTDNVHFDVRGSRARWNSY